MKKLLLFTLVLFLPAAVRAEEAVPNFTRDIVPFMKSYCADCHRPGKAKGGLDVTGYDVMFRGKKGKKMIVAGEPDRSPLLTTMLGKGKVMPPRKEKHRPGAADIARVRAWIAAGAKKDG